MATTQAHQSGKHYRQELELNLESGLRIGAIKWFEGETQNVKRAAARVICVHGWLDAASSFDVLVPLLLTAQPDLKIVAIDLPGHGKSSHKSRDAQYSPESFLLHLRETVRALGWDDVEADTTAAPPDTSLRAFSLIGHSLGAIISSRFAAIYPELVSAVVAIDALGGGTNASPAASIDRLRSVVDTTFLRQSSRAPRFAPLLSDCVDRMLANNPHLSRFTAEVLTSRTVASRPVADGSDALEFGFVHDPRLVLPSRWFSEDESRLMLSRIACPVFIVWAQHRFYPSDPATDRTHQNLIPNAVVVGPYPYDHHIHISAPLVFSDSLFEFVRTRILVDKASS